MALVLAWWQSPKSLPVSAWYLALSSSDAEVELLPDDLRLFSDYFWQILANHGYFLATVWQILATLG